MGSLRSRGIGKNVSSSLFYQRPKHVPAQLQPMGCSEHHRRVQEQIANTLAILRYLRSESRWFWTVLSEATVLQSKEITTSKDFHLVEKLCYFKNGLTYPNKISKRILLYLFWNEEICFVLVNCYVQSQQYL